MPMLIVRHHPIGVVSRAIGAGVRLRGGQPKSGDSPKGKADRAAMGLARTRYPDSVEEIAISKKSKRPGATPFLPPGGDRQALCEKLPIFEPHDISALIKEARSTAKTDIDRAVLAASRRRTDEQLLELLRCLGIDPSDPRAWEKGFYLLAFCHHGAGQISVYQNRTNRNAAKWTPGHDYLLLKEVMILKRNGLSERDAVKELAANKRKMSQFPYGSWRHSSVRGGQKNREDALRARLQKLKSKGRDHSGLAQILCAEDGGLSSIEALLLASTVPRLQQDGGKLSSP